ncbi:MAG: hypothetical protein RL722_891 [Pseudomonadota bacterium]|jgi:DedD protein
MGLFSKFRRPAAASPALSRDDVELVRTRARRRLVGAAILVLLAVIGLPLLLESQPRPLSESVGIEIGGKLIPAPMSGPGASAGALPVPPTFAASGAVAEPERPTSGRDVAPAPMSTVASVQTGSATTPATTPAAEPPRAAAPRVAETTPPQPAPAKPVTASASPAVAPKVNVAAVAPPPPPVAKPAPAKAEAAKPEHPKPTPAPTSPPAAAPAAKPAPAPAAAGSAQRFVVQVGAFEQASAARETRVKVEKLGLKAFEQGVDLPNGGGHRIRVRVGPYASREEADHVAARLSGGGLPAKVMAP